MEFTYEESLELDVRFLFRMSSHELKPPIFARKFKDILLPSWMFTDKWSYVVDVAINSRPTIACCIMSLHFLHRIRTFLNRFRIRIVFAVDLGRLSRKSSRILNEKLAPVFFEFNKFSDFCIPSFIDVESYQLHIHCCLRILLFMK